MKFKSFIDLSFILILCCSFFSTGLSQQTINVISWNLESGDADVNVYGSRVADMQNIDIWGLSEVHNANLLDRFELFAEEGENANYESILSATGGGDRLAIVYDADRFTLLDQMELDNINIGGGVRSPLVVQLLENDSGIQFFFMVNHLYRSRADRRHQQSRLLNEWVEQQTLPVIAVGDYNYDWDVNDGDEDHDLGYDLITAGELVTWVRPQMLTNTQCSATNNGGCRFNSVLDFVFVGNFPSNWEASSTIIVVPGDFPDNRDTPDHRPVLGTFEIPAPGGGSTEELRAQMLAKITNMENELAELRLLAEQICNNQ
ncbi:MAG: endonuclease/exonuclease/phosphatase family protein [Bacteroidota bacterium]